MLDSFKMAKATHELDQGLQIQAATEPGGWHSDWGGLEHATRKETAVSLLFSDGHCEGMSRVTDFSVF